MTKVSGLPVHLLKEMDALATEMVKQARGLGIAAPPMTIAEKNGIFGNVAKYLGLRFGKIEVDDKDLIDEFRGQLKGPDHKRAQRRRVDAAVSRATTAGFPGRHTSLDNFKREFLPSDDGDDDGDCDGDQREIDTVVVNTRGVRIGVASGSES